MMELGAVVLEGAVALTRLLLAVALVMAFVRLVRGPTVPDRVAALDLTTTLVVGIIAVHVIESGEPLFLRPAIVVALLTFLSTVALASYLEKRGRR